jgi:hypothetical protein
MSRVVTTPPTQPGRCFPPRVDEESAAATAHPQGSSHPPDVGLCAATLPRTTWSRTVEKGEFTDTTTARHMVGR